MVAEDMIEEITELFCDEAHVMEEAGITYVYLPDLHMPMGNNPPLQDALLSLNPRDGYPTRLFLSSPIPGKGSNWSIHNILGKSWHTISWNYVEFNGRLADVLANHLKAFA